MFTKRNLIIFAVTATVLGVSLAATHTRAAGDLTPKEARRLIAHLAGIQLPSDAVRVKDIDAMGNSAVVTAQVETGFRFVNENGKWRVVEIRTGDRRWENVDMLVNALNAEKAARVRAELETIATALESFKRERGFYVETTSEAKLIDFLNPHYLLRVIRIDPWHQPYEYEGTRASYVLRSNGPDGKANTDDDITVKGPSH